MSKIAKRVSILICGVLLLSSLIGLMFISTDAFASNAVYYFDSSASNGGNGSFSMPYNNLDSITRLELKSGDKVLLKRGSTFLGRMVLEGIEGQEGEPVIFGAYGEGNMPRINGNNTVGSGVVYIKNCQWIELSDWEIYDSATYEADRRGVLIEGTGNAEAEDVNVYTGITLRNLYIHHIKGVLDAANAGMSLAAKKTGGIHVWTDGNARFDKLTITQNRITDVDTIGISTWHKPATGGADKVSPYDDEAFARVAHTNVQISDNDISYIGKNAIFVRNLMGGVVERNTMYETAINCYSGNTICTSYVRGTVVQYNEGYLNRAKARVNAAGDTLYQDGCLLDADLVSRDVIFQYNYSHDNAFGLLMCCQSQNQEAPKGSAIVRYNLSVNDGGIGTGAIVYVNYAVEDLQIYNNTIVCGKDTEPTILRSNKTGRNFSFINNIIYNLSPNAKFVFPSEFVANVSISDNIIFNAEGGVIENIEKFAAEDSRLIQNDPQFAGSMGISVADRCGMERAEAFQVKTASVALKNGRDINGDAETDFFGNAKSVSIGMYCGNGQNDVALDYPINPDDLRDIKYHVVDIINDVKYATVTTYKGASLDLHMDIFSAADCAVRNRPLLVMVHGGGFAAPSSKYQSYAVKIAALMAKRGYVVASIDYRVRNGSDMPTDESEIPAMFDAMTDLNTAVEWLRANAGVYGFNPDYMFVSGGSAGGRTVMGYAYAKQETGFNRDGILAVGNLWGGPETWFNGIYDSNFEEGLNIPVTFIHGTRDQSIPIEYGKAVYDKMTAKGIYAEWNPISGASHSLIGTDDSYEMTSGILAEFFADRIAEKIQKDGGYSQPPARRDKPVSTVEKPISTKEKVYPNSDLYVYSYSCGKYFCYKDSPILEVNYTGNAGYIRKTYMRFDTVMSKKGAYLSEAALTFNVSECENVSATKPFTMRIWGIADNTWLENEVTYQNQPSMQGAKVIAEITVTTPGTYTVDVSNYLMSLHDEKMPTAIFMLEGKAPDFDGTQKITIPSTESGSQAPYLACEYGETKPKQYTVSVSVNGEGSVDLDSIKVYGGGNAVITCSPKPAYKLASYAIDTADLGVTVSASGNTVIVSNITADTNLTVSFVKDDDILLACDSAQVRKGAGNSVENNTDNANPANIKPLYVNTPAPSSASVRMAYIKFDISEFLTASRTIEFQIYCYQTGNMGGVAMPVDVYGIAGADWSSSELTWNNQPILDYIDHNASTASITRGAQLLGTLSVRSSATWHRLDVTNYVTALKRAGINQFTIVLIDRDAAATAQQVRFYSSHSSFAEDGRSMCPQLKATVKEDVVAPPKYIALSPEVTNASRGTVEYDKSVIAEQPCKIKINAQTGYTAVAKIDGVTCCIEDGILHVANPNVDTKIEISFVKLYNVNVTCDQNSASNITTLQIGRGEGFKIVFTANKGYKLEVKVNGVKQDLENNTLVFANGTIQDLNIVVNSVAIN